MTRTTTPAGALTCALVLTQAAAALAGTPSEIVSRTADQVIAILRDESLSHDQRKAKLEDIAYQRFDLETASKLVLAQNWKKFDDAQREAYLREFKRYLADYYGDRIDRYEQEEVEVLSERESPNGDVTVRTRIVGGNLDAAVVDYRMRRKDDTWYVIDVIAEGISFVKNFREQFREFLSRGGPDALIAELRKKNEAYSGRKKSGEAAVVEGAEPAPSADDGSVAPGAAERAATASAIDPSGREASAIDGSGREASAVNGSAGR